MPKTIGRVTLTFLGHNENGLSAFYQTVKHYADGTSETYYDEEISSPDLNMTGSLMRDLGAVRPYVARPYTPTIETGGA